MEGGTADADIVGVARVGEAEIRPLFEGDVTEEVIAFAAWETALLSATSSQRLCVKVSNSFSNCRNSEK